VLQKDEMPSLEELNEAFKGEKVLQRVASLSCCVLQCVAVCDRMMPCVAER